MSKTPKVQSPDDLVMTKEMFARAKRAKDIPEIAAVLAKMRGRGPQKAPTKKLTSIRLSEDVLKALRSTGPGWQTRADEILREKLLGEAA